MNERAMATSTHLIATSRYSTRVMTNFTGATNFANVGHLPNELTLATPPNDLGPDRLHKFGVPNRLTFCIPVHL